MIINKIIGWQNIEEYLPVLNKRVLLKLNSKYEYVFAYLDNAHIEKNKVNFLSIDDSRVIESSEVKEWCYVEFED